MVITALERSEGAEKGGNEHKAEGHLRGAKMNGAWTIGKAMVDDI